MTILMLVIAMLAIVAPGGRPYRHRSRQLGACGLQRPVVGKRWSLELCPSSTGAGGPSDGGVFALASIRSRKKGRQ